MMKKSRNVIALCLAMLVVQNGAFAQQHSPIAEKIAKAYGLDSYEQIEAIRYTFNAEFPGVKVSRSWEWHPKTDEVSFEGQDKSGKTVKVAYKRSELNSQPANVKSEIDPGFINDNYWFEFPFHAYWDTSATVTDSGVRKLPIGNGSARLVSVKYPNNGGYTPGDTWDLYLGKDNRIEQFVYHRGGATKPSIVKATWAGYKKAGPLLVSSDHRGTADGKPLHLFFTNVAVKMSGSDTWVNAQ